MSKQEIMDTEVCEMDDMISCLSVYNGVAKEKVRQKTLDEVLEMK